MNRLDKYINSTFNTGREKAKELINNGEVLVNGIVLKKPSFMVCEEDVVTIERVDYNKYVSRGAYKLLQAIEEFSIEIDGLRCIDIGASTGGFTDVMLQHGAKSVFCVDTGKDQLHEKILSDDRVTSYENTNILDIDSTEYGKFEFATIDVSFVSIKKIIPHAVTLLEKNATVVFLVKPQFEVGKSGLNKKGVVKNIKDREKALNEVIELLGVLGFSNIKFITSETVGHSGNIEYLVSAKYN